MAKISRQGHPVDDTGLYVIIAIVSLLLFGAGILSHMQWVNIKTPETPAAINQVFQYGDKVDVDWTGKKYEGFFKKCEDGTVSEPVYMFPDDRKRRKLVGYEVHVFCGDDRTKIGFSEYFRLDKLKKTTP